MDRIVDRVPALLMAVGVVGGILMCGAGLAWWWAASVAFAGLLLLSRRSRWGMLAMAFAAGWLTAWLHRPAEAPERLFDGKEHVFHAYVSTDEVHADGVVDLTVDDADGPFKVVALSNSGDNLVDGERVVCRGVLAPLRPVADMPYAPVPDVNAVDRGCVAVLETDGEIQPYGGDGGSYMSRCRARAEGLMVKAGADDEALGLYAAILLGDDSMIGSPRLEDFRAAGVAHALALSGFHIGFIALLAGALLYPLRLWHRAWRWRAIGVLAVVWGYAVMTGFGASTVRACIMMSALMSARLSGRNFSPWNSLCLAIALILCVAPAQLHSVGFQLSVSAVAGILAFSQALTPVSHDNAAYAAVRMVAVPVAAMLGTSVATAAYFHVLPVYSLLSIRLIAVIFPLFMCSGVALVALGALGISGGVMAHAANGLCRFVETVVEEVASWPEAQTGPVALTAAGVGSLAVLLVAAAVAVNFRERKVLLPCAAAMLAAVVSAYMSAPVVPRSEVFVVPAGTSVAMVMRHDDSVKAVLTSAPQYMAASRRKLDRMSALYLRSRSCGPVESADGDFRFGPFVRMGQYIRTGRTVTGVPCNGMRVDSLAGGADYVVVCGQCRAGADVVFRRMAPDTLVLAPGLGEEKRKRFVSEAALRGVPVIDMQTRAWAPALR